MKYDAFINDPSKVVAGDIIDLGEGGYSEVLDEVVVDGSDGEKSQFGTDGFNTARDAFNYSEYASMSMGFTQIGMLEYRASLPIDAKIGTFSRFSAAYKSVGAAGKLLGGASTVGSVLGVGFDYKAMQNGQIGVGRFAYRTTGVGASIAAGATIGGPYGAVGGGLVGGAFWIGEKSYDTANWFINELSKGVVRYENALKKGWYPGK